MRYFLYLWVPLLWLASPAMGQQRHALIVGINDYSHGGNKIVSSLKGCVNDAKSMRGLLINRFGFKPADIDTMYDSRASKAQILAGFRRLAQKVKPNDVVVFFFAGHGMSFINSGAQKKEKTSEGILAADVSSPANTIIFDWELSAIYNHLIAKGAILTVMLDCCYSGNMLANAFGIDEFVLREEDIEEVNNERSIAPGKVWGIGSERDDLDSMVKQARADTNVAFFMDQAATQPMIPVLPKLQSSPEVIFDSVRNDWVVDSAALAADARFVPFTDENLNISNRVQRSHEIKNGRILFMAASQGTQKAKERTDGLGVRQGVFTRSVITAYNQGSVNMPVSELQKRVEAIFRRQSLTPDVQWPNYVMDESRRQQSLLGVPMTSSSDKQLVRVKAIDGQQVRLNAGFADGLAPGFELVAQDQPSVRLRITTLQGDGEALAVPVSGSISQVRGNQAFQVSARNKAVGPALRIYLPRQFWTNAEVRQIDAQLKASPIYAGSLLRYPKQMNATSHLQYENRQILYGNQSSGFKPLTPVSLVTRITADQRSTPTYGAFVYLPISQELFAELRRQLAGNPNVAFVSQESQANFSLYAAYQADGAMVVCVSDELLKYKRGTKPVVQAERDVAVLQSVKDASKIKADAASIVGMLNRMAAKFRWLE